MLTPSNTGQPLMGVTKSSHRRRGRAILATALLGFACTANAQVLLDADFESGSYPSGWRSSGNDPIISGGSEPTCRGKHASKFVLDYYKSSVSYRTEYTLGGVMAFEHGNEYWMGFAIYLPDDWVDDDGIDILAQMHSKPDKHLGEDYRNPSMGLTIKDGKWRIDHKWDSKKVTEGNNYEGTREKYLGSYQTGRWTEFVLHFKMTYDSTGWIEIWKDGVKMGTSHGGMAFNDEAGGYLKTGNYKPSWKTGNGWSTGPSGTSRRVHFLDQLRITDGGGSYEEVAPNCGQVAPPSPAEPSEPTPPAAPKGLRLSIE